MKKLIVSLLAALLMLPVVARDFEYTYEGQTLIYTVIDEEAKTCKTKAGNSDKGGNKVLGVLVIPSEATDGEEIYKVTEIGNFSFENNDDLISVTIPNSVTSIGFAAFYQCEALTEVIMGDAVTTMGEDVFAWCTALTSLSL